MVQTTQMFLSNAVFLQVKHDQTGAGGVQASGGLIQEDDRWALQQTARDGESFSLTRGEAPPAQEAAAGCLVLVLRQAHRVEHFVHSFRNITVVAHDQFGGEFEILATR